MGRRVTVAYESAARERAAERAARKKLKWHRAAGGGLTAKGERGEYCIVRQRPDRRHGIYRYGVTHAGHSIGSTETLAAGKGLAVHHEVRQTCAEVAVVQEGASESKEARRGSYRSELVKNLRLMGQPEPEAFADAHATDVERYEIAGVQPNIAAAILVTSGEHRMHRDVAERLHGGGGASESRRYRLRWEDAPDEGLRAPAIEGGFYTVTRQGELTLPSGSTLFLGSRHRAQLEAERIEALVVLGPDDKTTFNEAPTRGEWEVVVSHPPSEHRGRILSMAGPGYGESRAGKIYLYGFYDDEEARHVANSISRLYGSKYGTTVTFGPRRSMAAEDSHPGVVTEERRRPGANRDFLRKKANAPCDHDCPDGTCKPFTKLERDPEALKACMVLGAEVGVLDTSRKLYELVRGDLEKRDREVFLVICLDFRGQLRDYVELSIGQRHRVAVDIEDVLQVMILSGCDGAAVCHVHPSGNAEPSRADRQLTKSIEEAMAIACPNVKLIDHLVVGNGQFYSFKDKRLVKV
jgi:proteasome lid subunit RPN8/RPN11